MNLLTTIPKSKFPDWATAERTLRRCNGETDSDGDAWFWLINTTHLPKKELANKVCYMLFDGQIRGYFDIVDTDLSENWRDRHDIGKDRSTNCIVMANWHPITNGPDMKGFQGWRYTHLSPLHG